MKNTFKKPLLASVAIIALTSLPALHAAHAADINSGTSNSQLIATGNDETLSVTGTGILDVNSTDAISTDTYTGIDILIDTTGGVTASAGNQAIVSNSTSSTLDSITVTDGFVTSDSANTTIAITGGSNTITIGTSTDGSITNTATGGDAILINDDDTGQLYNVIINNAGDISVTDDSGSAAIRLLDGDSASSIDLNNTGTINAGTTGSAVVLDNTNTLDLDNTGAGAITGAITTADGTTNILNANTATIDGDITTGTGSLTLDITGGTVTGDVSTTSGNTNIDINGGSLIGNVDLGDSATGVLDVTSGTLDGDVTMDNTAQIFTYSGGTFTGAVDGAGQFHVDGNLTTSDDIGGSTPITELEIGNGAILTLGADVFATDVNVDDGTLNFGGTARTVTGDLTTAGTGDSIVDVQGADHTVTGTFTLGAGDTFDVNVAEDGNTPDQSGSLSANIVNVAAGALLDIDLGTSEFIDDGQTYTILDGTNAGTITAFADGNIDVNGNGSNTAGLITFTTTTDGTDVTLIASRSELDVVGDDPNSSSLGAALETIGNAGTDDGTEVEVFIDAVLDSNTEAEANEILASATPETDNSLTQGVFSATAQSVSVISNRLSSARTGSNTGLSSGDELAGSGFWAQGYGGTAGQDDVDGISGYDADTFGFAVGADKQITDEVTLGLSGSYSETDVDSNAGLQSTNVDSYQINMYGSFDRDNYYVDGIAGVAFNNYDTSREILAPVSTANAEFDGQTYIAKAATGYIHALSNGIEFTPNVSLTYAHNTIDTYTETGAGAMSLTVDQDSSDQLAGRIGLNVAKTFEVETDAATNIQVRPELKFGVSHDFIGDAQNVTSNFQGIPTTFITEGAEIEKTTYEIGAGIDFMDTNGFTLSANYDYAVKSNYDSHIGALKARYEF